MSATLDQIIDNQRLWKGHRVFRPSVELIQTGDPTLDRSLSGGWAVGSVNEIYHRHFGLGEMRFLFPCMQVLGSRENRLQVWLDPIYTPYAPALQQHSIPLSKLLLVKTRSMKERLHQLESCSKSGSCSLVVAWLDRISFTQARRLQLAAEQGRCIVFLFLNEDNLQEAHPVESRLRLFKVSGRLQLELIKRKSGWSLPPFELNNLSASMTMTDGQRREQ